MSWTNLPITVETLEAATVNKVYENIQFLRDKLEEYEYTVDTLDVVNARYYTQIVDVRTQLQNVENDLTKINEGITSAYYIEHKDIGVRFKLTDYQRWVKILNDLYDILVNGKGRWGILTLSDCIPTINDQNILIRGETVGS